MGKDRRPRRQVPYRLVRIPRETVIARFAEGARLREYRDPADASVYERRGLLEV